METTGPTEHQPAQQSADHRAESDWARRLREATARLDAVGLPEPKQPFPDPAPTSSQASDGGRTRANRPTADPFWRPNFWMRETPAQRDARLDAVLAEFNEMAVRRRAEIAGQ